MSDFEGGREEKPEGFDCLRAEMEDFDYHPRTVEGAIRYAYNLAEETGDCQEEVEAAIEEAAVLPHEVTDDGVYSEKEVARSFNGLLALDMIRWEVKSCVAGSGFYSPDGRCEEDEEIAYTIERIKDVLDKAAVTPSAEEGEAECWE